MAWSEADLRISAGSFLDFSHPPDGPRATSRPPSYPRTPTYDKEEACLLQRLPNALQLAGEQSFVLQTRAEQLQHKPNKARCETSMADPSVSQAPGKRSQ